MKNAYRKDIWRTIKNGKKRFLSLVIITTLGVTMYTGLRASCVDLRYTADTFFDEQKLFDIDIVSTLGLTDEDVQVIGELEGVEQAEGAYSESVYVQEGVNVKEVLIKTLSPSGMNYPKIVEGTLPRQADEIAVTSVYLNDTGKSIGDMIEIQEKEDDEEDFMEDIELEDDEEEEDPDEEENVAEDEEEEESSRNFPITTYTITAVVVDPTDINSAEGAVGFRSNNAYDYTFFVLPEAVDSDVYTDVFVRMAGTEELLCYSQEYEKRISELTAMIEGEIKEQREQARYEEVTGEAYDKIADAEEEMYEKFDEADQEFADARKELDDGWKEFRDGQAELEENALKAEDEFAKAWDEIDEGYHQINSGARKLNAAEEELKAGEEQLLEGKETLAATEEAAMAQLAAAKQQLADSGAQVAENKSMLEAQVQQMAEAFGEAWPAEAWNAYVEAATEAYLPVVQLQMQISSLEKQIAQSTEAEDTAAADAAGAATADSTATDAEALEAQLAAAKEQLAQAEAAVPVQMEETQTALMQALSWMDEEALTSVLQLGMGLGQVQATEIVLGAQVTALEEQESQAKVQFEEAWKTIEEQEQVIEDGKKEIEKGRNKLVEGWNKLKEGEQELTDKEEEVRQELADGRKELADAETELSDGEAEYEENYLEYQEERKDAEEKIADAKKKVEDIDMTKWYVQDRSSLSGYANVKSDAAAIEAIGTMFPIIFLVVAVLISLTTITRMVEEERGLIGTYKALGFTDGEIRRKYLTYSSSACLMGGLLGDFCGFVVLPKIIFIIFGVMYELTDYQFHFDWVYGTTGILLFVAAITISAFLACQAGLRQMPAVLMRPKSPKSGSRVFLERLTFLWKRLSFLNKVTARNLFRYKKRLLMTIFGIMGCTALVLCAFTIQNSVTDLMLFQYHEVYQYDLMTVSSDDDHETVVEYLGEYDEIKDYQEVRIESIKVKNSEGNTESLQLTVLPDDGSFEDYITFTTPEGDMVHLSENDIFVTQNASMVLDFETADTIYLQNLDLVQCEAAATQIVENYLGNGVYMTQSRYEALFGEWKPNGALINLHGTDEEKLAFAQEFGKKEELLTCTSTQEMEEEFSVAFTLIRMVVVVVLVLAASLAFVVLFTLASTNISERERELATIKVLGFYDREVHSYVNKETMILTAIGILLGLPVGRTFGFVLMGSLEMSGIFFKPTLHTQSYGIAVVIVLGFALVVNLITNKVLDKIDPVEALKSVE